MKSVLLLTSYDINSASSRIRHIDLISELEKHEFQITHRPFFDYGILEDRYEGKRPRKRLIFNSYARRLITLIQSRQFDLLWIEKELFPFCPNWIERKILSILNKPTLIDLDDDWFAKYEQQIPRYLHFVVGKYKPLFSRNVYYSTTNLAILTKIRLSLDENQIVYLPPYFDSSRNYSKHKIHVDKSNDEIKVGWIGSPMSSIHQLTPNLNVLKAIADKFQIHLIGGSKNFDDIPNVFIHPWTLETEVEVMMQMDIAIMPLANDAFTVGKSGYKAVQFMALGIPVVASNLGNSSELLGSGRGLIVESEEDWLGHLMKLSENTSLRDQIGRSASTWVKTSLDIDVFLEELVGVFKELTS